jgi:tRNA A37 N6-isopentenylltransferase MiaA
MRSGDCALSSHFAEVTDTKVIPVDASEVYEELN